MRCWRGYPQKRGLGIWIRVSGGPGTPK
jgi:hypothetical protein